MKNNEENKSITTSLHYEISAFIALNQEKMDHDKTKSDLQNSRNMIKLLEEQIKLLKHQKFAKKSESSKSMNIEMTFDDLDTNEQESVTEPEIVETITVGPFARKKKVGRKIDTSALPREVIIHDLSELEKNCACCQSELCFIGDDVSEKIELVPAIVKVIEHITKKYACRTCKTVVSAKKQDELIPKCMAGNSLLSEVIISKYQYHLPLYRQSKMLLHAGIDIPDNTIGNWVMKIGDALKPLRDALVTQISKTRTLQADETPIKVLSDDKKAYMWAFHSCDPGRRFVLFEYDLTRAASVPGRILSDFNGILQTDGYGGYNVQRAESAIISVACFAHARRKFTDVIKVASVKTPGKAHEGLSFIDKLYRIERTARKNDLNHTERYALRQSEALPILTAMKAWLDKSINQSGCTAKRYWKSNFLCIKTMAVFVSVRTLRRS